MANIIVNANGTVSESFSIGKTGRGIVIYQGDNPPSNLLGNTGDIFVKRSAEPYLLKKNSTGWVNVNNLDIDNASSNVTVTPVQSSTLYLVDSSTSEITLTLATSSLESGKQVTFKDSQGSSGTNTITVQTEGSETIDGGGFFTMTANYTSVTITSDGTNWFII